jgi:hypothetical protein
MALRFGIDVLLVLGKGLDLFLDMLDPLDESTQLITRNPTWVSSGSTRPREAPKIPALLQAETANVVSSGLRRKGSVNHSRSTASTMSQWGGAAVWRPGGGATL